MVKILKPLQIIYSIYAMLLFIILMFPVLIFSIIASAFGKLKGGNLIYKACNIWARIWYGLIGIRHKEIYESPHDKTKQYIFVANHISYLDIPATVRCIQQPIRVLGKYEMVKYPFFGLIYRMAVIVVDRKNAEGRALSIRMLKAALRKGISIFIFPEGTFNETEKPLKDFYNGAFSVALETQTSIKPLLFLDTNKRMNNKGMFTFTPGISRVVFMKEIKVDNYQLKNVQLLKKHVHEVMEQGLLRYQNDIEDERSKY